MDFTSQPDVIHMATIFSYSIFIHHPISSLAFFSLIMAFLSLWIDKRIGIWLSFIAVASVFAFISKIIDVKAIIYIGILGAIHLLLSGQVKGKVRLALVVSGALISFGLITHLLPGFHNWNLVKNLQISKDGVPYSLFLNFDKPFIGFFPLALALPLLESRFQIRTILLKTILLTLIGILVMMILAIFLHVVKIDLKFPHITPIWIIANLFLTTIPEEAFFRGFLQRELTEYLDTKWAGVFSIVAVSLLFTVAHIAFIKDLNFLLLSFVSSLIYGTIYHTTRSIEGSIFCHFLFNLTHFFFFTYPIINRF